jgi:VWFA-related protein
MTRRTVLTTMAALAAGTRRHCLTAQSGPVFKTGVHLVELYVTVVDEHGRYIDGLDQTKFEIRDEGSPQPIVSFGGISDPLSCAVLLDTTGSMQQVLPQVRSSILEFIDALGESDAIAICTFDTRLTIRQDFTTDKVAARRAVMRTRAAGSTALFDALAQTAHEIAPRAGKKAIVVFSDGEDNASALNASAAGKSLRKIGVPVYTIAEGEARASKKLTEILRDIARTTGGTASVVNKPSDIDAIFENISQDLRHSYLLVYKAPAVTESRWRTIEVALRESRKYRIRAKEGYFPD